MFLIEEICSPSQEEHLKTIVYLISFLEGERRQTERIIGVSKTKNRDSSDGKLTLVLSTCILIFQKTDFFSLFSHSSRHRKRTFSKIVLRMDIFVIWTNFVARRTKTEVFEYFDGVTDFTNREKAEASLPLFPLPIVPRVLSILFPSPQSPYDKTKEASAEERVNQWQTEAFLYNRVTRSLWSSSLRLTWELLSSCVTIILYQSFTELEEIK